MDFLYILEITNHDVLSDAYIFSQRPLEGTSAEVANLQRAQLIVESQWLCEFPTFAVPVNDYVKDFVVLYDNVKLILPDSWGAINFSDSFLVNRSMYDLFKDPDGGFTELMAISNLELRELFEVKMFVVASAG